MKRLITILALGGAFVPAMALAGDDCIVPMTDWQPREAVAKLAEANGWKVRRIKIDDGCYEVIGEDAQGHRIEAKINPGTLAVVEIERESGDDDGEGDD